MCMFTSHMILLPPSLFNLLSSFFLLISHLSPSLTYLHHSLLSSSHAERAVCGAQRQKKARQVKDLTERIQHPPRPVEPQHKRTQPPKSGESTCIHMHQCTHSHRHFSFFHFHSTSSATLLTLPPFTFHFLRSSRSSLFPSVSRCPRRGHLLLAYWSTWCSAIAKLFFIARAPRRPITEWLLSCGPAP